MKRIAIAALFLLLAPVLLAQTTNVTATGVADPNSGLYANGTWSVSFVPLGLNQPNIYKLNGSSFTQAFSGTTDATGSFSVTVADNNVVLPTGSKWQFQVCSYGNTCFQYQLVITGASMSIGGTLSAHSTPILGGLNFQVQPLFPTTETPIQISAAQGQTAPLANFTDAQGNVLFQIGPTGNVTCASGCAPTSLDQVPNGIIYIRYTWNLGPYPVVINGNFEDGTLVPPAGWNNASNAVASYDTTTPYEGLQSVKLTSNGGAGGSGMLSDPDFPANPGDVFTVRGAAKSDGTNIAGVCVGFIDKNFNAIGSYICGNNSTTTWTLVSNIAVAPANTVYATVLLQLSDVNGAVGEYDAVVLYRNTQAGVKFAQLPSAASAASATVILTDSTAITTEGQNCAGSSTNTALAFSNGSAWKCF